MSKPAFTYPIQPMTPDEIRRVLGVCRKLTRFNELRTYTITLFIWRSQCRVSEALAVTLDDLELDQNKCTVQCGKGKKRRVVGFDPQCSEKLREWLKRRAAVIDPSCKFLFPTRNGKRIIRDRFRVSLKQMAARAGITKRVHPHSLRHSGAMELLAEGVPVNIIQQQLGHSDLKTTTVYLSKHNPVAVLEAMQGRQW